MKSNITTLVSALLALSFYACQSPNASESASTTDTLDNTSNSHNSENALDWSGTYTGTLPCADCEGIQTTIMLDEDQSYSIKTTYLGEEDNIFEQQGTFDWNDEGNTITLSNMEDRPRQYFVGENTLTQLDMDGNKISGKLAENYMLKKNNTVQEGASSQPSITDTRWRLTELMGQSIDSTMMNKGPFIMLTSEDKRLQGNGGCNTVAGSYELNEGNRISFSQMVSTRMACPNMEVETQLLKVLETADNYSLNGNQLTLNKARMAPLARFEAEPGE